MSFEIETFDDEDVPDFSVTIEEEERRKSARLSLDLLSLGLSDIQVSENRNSRKSLGDAVLRQLHDLNDPDEEPTEPAEKSKKNQLFDKQALVYKDTETSQLFLRPQKGLKKKKKLLLPKEVYDYLMPYQR
jgi:hypothetical protein